MDVPFYSTKEGVEGLWLSIVLGIVNGHNGLINVERKDQYTNLTILFKSISQKVGNHNIHTEISKEDETSISIDTDKLILVIEDLSSVRKNIENMIEIFGFRSIFARNGRQGWEIIQHRFNEIDLIIMDIIIPELT